MVCFARRVPKASFAERKSFHSAFSVVRGHFGEKFSPPLVCGRIEQVYNSAVLSKSMKREPKSG